MGKHGVEVRAATALVQVVVQRDVSEIGHYNDVAALLRLRSLNVKFAAPDLSSRGRCVWG